MQYNNQNKGVIFKNDKKGNEKAPDYKGTIDIEGKEYEIALWVREGKNGKFFSTIQKAKEQRPMTAESLISSMPKPSEDDLPF